MTSAILGAYNVWSAYNASKRLWRINVNAGLVRATISVLGKENRVGRRVFASSASDGPLEFASQFAGDKD